jgi:hypothetical protein
MRFVDFLKECAIVLSAPLKGTKGSRGAPAQRTAMLEFRNRERYRQPNCFATNRLAFWREKIRSKKINQTESNRIKPNQTESNRIKPINH